MKILIRGAGFVNKGAEALMLTARDELQARIPNAEFLAELPSAEFDLARQNGLVPVGELGWGRGLSRVLIRGKLQKCIGLAPALFGPAVEKLYQADFSRQDIHVDATIDVSGYAYFGGASQTMMNVISYMRRHPGPCFFLPQAWGPLTTKQSRFFLRRMLEKAAAVYSRDATSSGCLKQCGFSGFLEAPDIALAFKRKSSGKEIPAYLQGVVGTGRPVIGIAPNMRVYERISGTGLENRYIVFLMELCRFCMDKLGATVILISNEIHPDPKVSDDQDLCELLCKQINCPQCIYQRQYYSAEMIRNITGRLDFLIGSRFHTLVFALSQGVPVMALGWAHKYGELLKGFGLENYSIGHEKEYDLNSATAKVTEVWDSRQALKASVSRHLDSHLRSIDDVFDRAASVINGK
jgi:colanic acid/amylovoran biosynthesis protein